MSLLDYSNFLFEGAKPEIPETILEAAKNAKPSKENALKHFMQHVPGGIAASDVQTTLTEISQNQEMLDDFIKGLHSVSGPDKITPADYEKPGSVGYKFFQLKPAGIGKGELFLAWLVENSIIQGGTESFDMMIGRDKFEVKDYRDSNSSAIRLGVKGKVAQFEFFSELVDTVRMLEKLKGRFGESKFDFSKYFDDDFATLADTIVSNKVKWFSGEINKGDLETIRSFYSTVNNMKMETPGYTNVIFRGPNVKPVEMSIAPLDSVEGGSITISPSTEDNSPTYIVTELKRIKYVRNPGDFDKDLQDTVNQIVGSIPFIIFRPKTINITTDFVFDRVSTGGVYIIERSQVNR